VFWAEQFTAASTTRRKFRIVLTTFYLQIGILERANFTKMSESNAGSRLILGPRATGVTLTQWLYDEIRAAILSDKLRRGWTLPPTRDFAKTMGVSRHIVVNVYAQLTSEGYLQATVGRGTRVSQELPDDFQLPANKNIKPARHVDVRPEGHDSPSHPFRLTHPSLDDFPLEAWNRTAARILRRSSRESLEGGRWAGLMRLRTAVAAHLGTSRGVACSPDNVVIVSGVQQALDLLARIIIQPGDPVWLEDPCYIGAVDAFRLAGARIVAVPVDENGLDPEIGRQLCPAPKAIYVTPAHQFGLGTTLSLERRFELLALCRQERTVLIEDDYDSEFRFVGRPLPALRGLPGADSVFLLGTFNKTLFPALRLGFMLVPDRWVDTVLALRYKTDRYPPTLSQEILAEFIESGQFTRHMRRMRQIYGERRDILSAEVARYLVGILQLPAIEAGLNTPAYLLNSMDSKIASDRAAKQGVEAWPINRYTISRRDLRGLMLGFAAFNKRQIHAGVVALTRALTNV
jgi:GntR family transcriptional regulator/MocR family aminotransferase